MLKFGRDIQVYIYFYQSHLVIVSARGLVRGQVVNHAFVCAIVSFGDFVSQFHLLKNTDRASVDNLSV